MNDKNLSTEQLIEKIKIETIVDDINYDRQKLKEIDEAVELEELNKLERFLDNPIVFKSTVVLVFLLALTFFLNYCVGPIEAILDYSLSSTNKCINQKASCNFTEKAEIVVKERPYENNFIVRAEITPLRLTGAIAVTEEQYWYYEHGDRICVNGDYFASEKRLKNLKIVDCK